MPEPTSYWRLLPAVAAVLGVILTAYLGNWQLDRAAYKRELQERYDHAARQPAVRVPVDRVAADTLLYRHVEAVGRFRPEMTVFLDNRVQNGTVGYDVVTPLQLKDSERYVLVRRGWVQALPERARLPEVRTPADVVSVEGIALPVQTRFFELSDRAESGPVWQNLKFDRFAATYRLDLQPIVVQQSNELADGLSRRWPPPGTGVDRHLAYALQWFVMSAGIAILYAVIYVGKKRRAT